MGPSDPHNSVGFTSASYCAGACLATALLAAEREDEEDRSNFYRATIGVESLVHYFVSAFSALDIGAELGPSEAKRLAKAVRQLTSNDIITTLDAIGGRSAIWKQI